ncbi:GAK system XXXCH domain-containing protein [Maridesulfovibrio ferrireducens]|uniref:GAK system XXXCH domain-containing protein n=1 Tax=Maridesulfovibrio ferrireducens TaxID=246191 RepID=UPI001A1C33FA|nr:GAK system XXXCH domain-containing protein [Maridesulfovibrio ferrireducens]MBI9112569.1 GAK system XXXCH domain-containing protein [Maridesulfovibrio ferrireducens]
MGKENKIEKFIKPDELPDFLRKMAEAIETGKSEDMPGFTFMAGFKKLKINISHNLEQTTIKIKAKPAYESEEQKTDDGISGRLKYSSLKKRMGDSFKIIFKTIHAGSFPPGETVSQFIEDSKLMVTYEGYGDEYYEEYITACDTFKNAVENNNIEEAHKACDSLNNIKAHCHSQHK